MPKKNGLAVKEEMTQLIAERTHNGDDKQHKDLRCRIIAVTAHPIRQVCMDLGFDDFVSGLKHNLTSAVTAG